MEGTKRQGGRRPALLFITLFAASAWLTAPSVLAFELDVSDDDIGWGDWGQVSFTWNTRLTAGAQVRTERRDDRLIDIHNVSGQETLCAERTPEVLLTGLTGGGDCQARFGEVGAVQIIPNARGGININGDDGNLNYDRGDVTYANFQARSELTAFWRNFTFKVSGLGYYDPVNNDFETHSEDVELPNRLLSGETVTLDRNEQRRDGLEDLLGEELRLLEAFVAADFDVAGRNLRIAIGDQTLRWGESTFMIFNNLARINPPSARLYDRPGTEVRDAFIPVGMVTASMNVTTDFNVEAFYQYDWKPVEPSVCGSFLSVSDVAGCGDGPTPVYLGLGQFPEDPNRNFTTSGVDSTLDRSSRTAFLLDEGFGFPDDGGQYGLRLDYFADWLNGGTELSLYAMNIHSRLPFFSTFAARESCLSLEGVEVGSLPDEFNEQVFSNCDSAEFGFLDRNTSGDFRQITETFGFPVESLEPFLDYPEDIKIYGFSGTTNIGDWSLAGELAYSPNQPAQVSVVDVAFAGVQPALPDCGDYGIGDPAPGGAPGLGNAAVLMFPCDRLFAPDFIETRYRGNEVEGAFLPFPDSEFPNGRRGDYIRGYERLKVGQVSLTGIRVLGSSNLFSAAVNADQILFIGELAAVKAFNMPGLNELQFQGSGAQQTHYSLGAAEADIETYGAFPFDLFINDPRCAPADSCRLIGPTDVLNPTRADEDIFADDFAWGYRMRVTADYNNALLGWKWTPGFTFYHDVGGTSISPGQDFVEDRKELTLSTDVLFTNEFSANLQYRFYWGAGDRNLRLDRDYAELSLSYAF